MQKRIVIMGATSGIGLATARESLNAGWIVGVAGRREELLEALRLEAPDRVYTAQIDVTKKEAPEQLLALVERMGGMDCYLHVSGIGTQNPQLDLEIEMRIVATNVEGFTRLIDTAYGYFRAKGGGHIAAISSIAGTMGLGSAPAYSATKRFQNTYLQALAQLSHMKGDKICFTDIKPGFVATDLLNDKNHYPLLMQPERVGRRLFRALCRRERSVIIDWRYALLVFVWRLIPSCIWERLSIKTRNKA